MKPKTYAALIAGLIFSLAGHANTCVEEMKYQDTLRVLALENWASNSVIYGGSSELECGMTKELTGLFVYMQDKMAEQGSDHRKLRGTHSKGICLNGTFTTRLEPSLKDWQKQILKQTGLFNTSAPLAASFRFANAASRILPDWKSDVRALSAKISLPDGGEQDFAFNNVPRFQIDSVENFVALMELQKGLLSGQITVTNGVPSLPSLAEYFRKLYGLFTAGRYLNNLNNIKTMATEDAKFHDSYASQIYWSTTAYAINPLKDSANVERVVKFGARPCTEQAGPVLSSSLKNSQLANEAAAKALGDHLVKDGRIQKAEDFLSESLVAQLKTAPVCYNLFVQFLNDVNNTDSATNLVENPSIIWSGPVYNIGQLTMIEAVDAKTCDDPANFVSVTTKHDGIYGIGQMNRAREAAESASWHNR